MNDIEIKQSICNQILGTTFKDIERAMSALINERQLTPAQQEMIEMGEQDLHKFDYELEFKLNKEHSDKQTDYQYRTYTKEEVAALIRASDAPYENTEPTKLSDNYPTYSRERVEQFMKEHFEYLEYKEEEKQKREKWDSLKTIESEVKTASTAKRSKSTKTSKRSGTRQKK